jgi:hypothetical protein
MFIIFDLLNNFNYPNCTFFVSSLILYSQYFLYDYILNFYSEKYVKLNFQKKKYVVSNLLKCNTLLWLIVFMFPLFIQPLKKEWPILAWKHACAIYGASDLVSLIMVTKHSTSTIIHHTFSVLLNLLAINIGDFSTPNLWQSLLYYGIYSSIAYLVNGFLSLRFLAEKDSKIIYYICIWSTYIYLFGCFINWSTQLYYFVYYIPISCASVLYFTSVINFIRDDLKLIKFQIKFAKDFKSQ